MFGYVFYLVFLILIGTKLVNKFGPQHWFAYLTAWFLCSTWDFWIFMVLKISLTIFTPEYSQLLLVPIYFVGWFLGYTTTSKSLLNILFVIGVAYVVDFSLVIYAHFRIRFKPFTSDEIIDFAKQTEESPIFHKWMTLTENQSKVNIVQEIIQKLSLRSILEYSDDESYMLVILHQICHMKRFGRSLARSKRFWDTILQLNEKEPTLVFQMILGVTYHCRKKDFKEILELGILNQLCEKLDDKGIFMVFTQFSIGMGESIEDQRFAWRKFREAGMHRRKLDWVDVGWPCGFSKWRKVQEKLKKAYEEFKEGVTLIEVEEKLCMECGVKSKVLFCARCESAWYCGRDCQKKAWRTHHKDECNPLED